LGFLLLLNAPLQAQVAGYTFSESAATFTPIAGGTNVTATGDDGTEINIPIGFTFNFAGTDYTQIGVSTNGVIRVGGGNFVTGFGAFSNNLTGTERPAIAPLWDDNHRNTGSISRLLSGTAPNRVLTIEYLGVNIGGGGATSATNTASFQVRIYETTNVVEFTYGSPLAAAGTLTASIGLTGPAAGDYISVTPAATSTVSTTAANNSIGAAALTNLANKRYTFTPPPPCSGTPTAGTLSDGVNPRYICAGTSTVISIIGGTAQPGIVRQWEQSDDGVGGWVNAVGGTGATTTTYTTPTLPAGTVRYYRLRVTCTNSSETVFTNTIQVAALVNSPATITSFPYVQNFDCVTGLPAGWTVENVNGGATWVVLGQFAFSPTRCLTYAWTETSINADDWAFTPPITMDASKGYTVRFKYRATDPTFPEDLQVVWGTAPNAASMPAANQIFENRNINFFAYADGVSNIIQPPTSGTYYIGFHVRSQDKFRLTIDDVIIEELDPCTGTPTAGTLNTPTSITACDENSFTLSISGATAAAGISYQWQQSTDGGSNWVNAVGGSGANSLNYTTPIITANISYRLQVSCSASGQSVASSVTNITYNPVVISSFPFTDSFESATPPALACGWTRRDENNDGTSWTVNNTVGLAATGNNYLVYTFSGVNTANDWAFTPALQLVAGRTYTLTFKYRSNSSTPEQFNVSWGNDRSAAAMTNVLVGPTTVPSTQTSYVGLAPVEFVPSANGIYYVGIRVTSAANSGALLIDDVEITETIPADALEAFDLSSPATDASVVLNAQAPTTEVNISWEATSNSLGQAITYRWLAINTGGNFNSPLLNILSNNNGQATTLTLTHQQIDEALATEGVAAGGVANLQWTVRATAATSNATALAANGPFNISFTRFPSSGGVTSLDDWLSAQLNIYPNPAINLLQLEIKDASLKVSKLQIFNQLGMLVAEQDLQGARQASIDVAQLGAGVYFVSIQTDRGLANKRLSILR
jgi:hypothetical protein